jgi:hypothetical protein
VPVSERIGYWTPVKDLTADDYKKLGIKLEMACAQPTGEMIYAEPGYSISERQCEASRPYGFDALTNWLQNAVEFGLTLNLPKGHKGTLRLFIVDSDNFQGGRKETIVVGGEPVGTFENFQRGRWVEVPVGADKTADGKLEIRMTNAHPGLANAVVSKVEWVEK